MSPRMFDSWPAGSSLAFLRQRNLLLPSARAWDEPTATWKLARNAESPIRSGAKTSGVVEVGEEVVEVRIAIVDDRLLDAVEHCPETRLGLSSVWRTNGGMTPISTALLTPADPYVPR